MRKISRTGKGIRSFFYIMRISVIYFSKKTELRIAELLKAELREAIFFCEYFSFLREIILLEYEEIILLEYEKYSQEKIASRNSVFYVCTRMSGFYFTLCLPSGNAR